MNNQELIEKYKELENGSFDIAAIVVCQLVLKDLEQLDEPQKVKVPQFVADWIEEARKTCKDVADFFDFDFTNEEVGKWFMQERPFDLVARAWLDGYEVEEEKRYRVKIKNVYHGDLGHAAPFEQFSFYIKERNHSGIRYEFTRKQLEEAGFGWVFDCSGIEIEEAE